MSNHFNISPPQRRRVRIGIAVAVLVLLQGCAYGYEPEGDPFPRGENVKRIPDDQGISLDGLVRRSNDQSDQKTAATAPGVDDPGYQEYLEWKEWQEFKRYEEWKRKQETDASE